MPEADWLNNFIPGINTKKEATMKSLLVILLSCVLSLAVQAGSSKQDAVDDLIEASKMEPMMEQIYAQMGQIMMRSAKQMGIKEDEQPIFQRHFDRMAEAMRAEMSWVKMKASISNIYIKHFTEKEIRDILAFYKTDSGRTMVDKMPLIMTDSMAMSQGMMKSFYPKMKAIATEMRAELMAHRKSQDAE